MCALYIHVSDFSSMHTLLLAQQRNLPVSTPSLLLPTRNGANSMTVPSFSGCLHCRANTLMMMRAMMLTMTVGMMASIIDQPQGSQVKCAARDPL